MWCDGRTVDEGFKPSTILGCRRHGRNGIRFEFEELDGDGDGLPLG